MSEELNKFKALTDTISKRLQESEEKEKEKDEMQLLLVSMEEEIESLKNQLATHKGNDDKIN